MTVDNKTLKYRETRRISPVDLLLARRNKIEKGTGEIFTRLFHFVSLPSAPRAPDIPIPLVFAIRNVIISPIGDHRLELSV